MLSEALEIKKFLKIIPKRFQNVDADGRTTQRTARTRETASIENLGFKKQIYAGPFPGRNREVRMNPRFTAQVLGFLLGSVPSPDTKSVLGMLVANTKLFRNF